MGLNIKNVSERVKDLLQNPQKEHLRDDDKRLLATVWWYDIINQNINPEELSAKDFLFLLSRGKLTSPESVRRSRAKLQEEDKSLRGEKYYKRKKQAQAVQTELGYNI